jgi:SAM-dependent methyltransferase
VRAGELHRSTAAQGCTWEFLHGDCRAIPSAPDRFDCVTCQTLLMHLPDPAAALWEFVRVVRPGGVVLVAEPVNLLNRAPMTALSFRLRPDAHARLFCFWRHHELGMRAAGLGDHSLGAQLASLFRAAGLVDSRFFCNDCPVVAETVGGDAALRDHLPPPSAEDYRLAALGGAPAELLAWAEAFFLQPADYLLPKETRHALAEPVLAQPQLIIGIGFKPLDAGTSLP